MLINPATHAIQEFSIPTSSELTGIAAGPDGNLWFAENTSNQIGEVQINTTAKTATTTQLAAAPNPSTFGQAVTFTATVFPQSGSGAPTGTVTFMDGSTSLGTAPLNGANQATFTTSSLAAGTHPITAVYGGDNSFATSTSAALSQTVNQAPTITTNPRNLMVNSGQTATFTAAASGGNPTHHGAMAGEHRRRQHFTNITGRHRRHTQLHRRRPPRTATSTRRSSATPPA